MGLVPPLKELPTRRGAHILFRRFAPALRAFTGAFRGAYNTRRAFREQHHVEPEGAISEEPLPPICRPGACSLPDGERLLRCLCLAERPPTTRREVFAFDERVPVAWRSGH